MEEKQELNDIILNKGSGSNTKKTILAVATLGVILVIVVLVMNTINSTDTTLPETKQVALPPKPEVKQQNKNEEPLFEDVEVVDEQSNDEEKLDDIAKKLKKQSKEETQEVVTVEDEPKSQTPVVKKQSEKKVITTQKTPVKKGSYYVQVGSFSKYAPDNKFLNKIKANGYNYSFHKVVVKGKTITKVVIGPYKTKSDAKKDLGNIRKSIIKGAFIVKLRK